jgi:hypothetical protein
VVLHGGAQLLLGLVHLPVFRRQTQRFLGDVPSSRDYHCFDGIFVDLQFHSGRHTGARHSRLCRYLPRGIELAFFGNKTENPSSAVLTYEPYTKYSQNESHGSPYATSFLHLVAKLLMARRAPPGPRLLDSEEFPPNFIQNLQTSRKKL